MDRKDVDRLFKNTFDEYDEDGGIPLGVLRERISELQDDSISASRTELLLQKADANADGRLSYAEFLNLMTERHSTEDIRVDLEVEGSNRRQRANLTRFQRLVRTAVSSVVPGQATNRAGTPVVDDYLEHYNCRPPPLFMIIISAVQLIIFIIYAVELSGTSTPITATSGAPLYSPFIYNPARRYEVWRYLTYMFIHVGYMHLIFNLVFQLLLGIPLELVHKWWRMAIVYLLGVIAGSMAHSVTDTSTLLAGASGGCYSLIGAHFAIVIMNWKEMTHNWMKGPIKFIASAPVRLAFWTILAGIDTALAIYNRYTNSGGQNVGYAAHFGGALAGLLIGIPVLRNIDEKLWEKVVWWVALIIYLCCVVAAVAWNAFYPHFPVTDWRPCCPSPA